MGKRLSDQKAADDFSFQPCVLEVRGSGHNSAHSWTHLEVADRAEMELFLEVRAVFPVVDNLEVSLHSCGHVPDAFRRVREPYNLHPTPYIPHPTPYTPHPTPCTLHHTFYPPRTNLDVTSEANSHSVCKNSPVWARGCPIKRQSMTFPSECVCPR